MRKLTALLIVLLILSACSTGQTADQIEATINARVIATLTAMPTATAQPTNTPIPAATNTPKPTNTAEPTNPTPKPTTDINELRTQLLDAVATDVGNILDVQSVTLTRFNKGVLEIELKTRWASRDSQADVSFAVIQPLAKSFAAFNRDGLETVAGGPFAIHLTTYSTDGNYRYQSTTDFDTLTKLANRSMSYAEWVAAAGAGFK